MKRINHTQIQALFDKSTNKEFVKIMYNCKAYPSGSSFSIYCGSSRIAEVLNDLDVVVYDVGGAGDKSLNNRYNWISGAWVRNAPAKNTQQKNRIWSGTYPNRKDLPLTSGLVVRCAVKSYAAEILNPEICREFKRVLCRSKRKELYPRIEQVAKTLLVSVSLGEVNFETDAIRALCLRSVEDLYSMAEDDPYTVGLVLLCKSNSGYNSKWRYNRQPEDVKKQIRITSAKSVIAGFTEAVYEQFGAYRYEEVQP